MERRPAPRPPLAGILQRKCACGGKAEGQCEECKKKETLQRRAIGREGPPIAPPVVHHVLQSPGQTLDPAARRFMEERFGHDFGRVRVHADPAAAESAQAVSAIAYTVGSHIIFGSGAYAPSTAEGRSLLAHELAHVVQQRGASGSAGTLEVQDAADAQEHEASSAATRAMSSGPALVHAAPIRPRLRRQKTPDLPPLTGFTGDPLMDSLAATITLDAFASDSAELTSAHHSRLAEYKKQVAALLVHYPDSFMTIVGHTDATDTEAHNEKLGQDRADAVLAELSTGDNAVPKEIMRAYSMGERSLEVETQAREPRSRRVQIQFHARRFINLPPIQLNPPGQPAPGGGLGGFGGVTPSPGFGQGFPGFGTPGPGSGFGGFGPIPKTDMPSKEWLKDAVEQDKIVKSLPSWMKDKVVEALKDADEKIVEKAIDALPLDGKTKAAVQAAAKTVLQMLKGKKFTPPVPQPPQYQQPPSNIPPFPKMPGEVLIPGPTFKF
jgi:outer membrane protein OmpA-like peptidoglycan-associated protein